LIGNYTAYNGLNALEFGLFIFSIQLERAKKLEYHNEYSMRDINTEAKLSENVINYMKSKGAVI